MDTVIWVLLLLLAAGGPGTPHDLASLIEPEDYFRSRNLALTPEALAERLSADPADGKAQIRQLLAIRWLADHPAEVKKAAALRAALEAVAQGKTGQDRHGFARQYATLALAKLDGKPLPAAAPPERLTDGLAWFPAGVNFVACAELGGGPEGLGAHPLAPIFAAAPKDREEQYTFAESVGNLRLDRVAVGLEIPPGKTDPRCVYFRLTGAGDLQALSEYLLRHGVEGVKRKEEKGARGEPILILTRDKGPDPAMALVGDTDLLVAGYERTEGDHLEVLRQALDVRAGKAAAVTTGPLKDLLKEVPARAGVLVVGELNEALLDQFRKLKGPIALLPQRFVGTITHDRGAAIRLDATFKDAAEAKEFVDGVGGLRTQAVEALKNPPPALPRETARTFTALLNDARLEAREAKVSGSLIVPPETLALARDQVFALVRNWAEPPRKR